MSESDLSFVEDRPLKANSADKFSCGTCNAVYSHKRGLVQHLKAKDHTEVKVNAKSGNNEDLEVVETGRFVCQKCARAFPSQPSLSSHKGSHSKNDKKNKLSNLNNHHGNKTGPLENSNGKTGHEDEGSSPQPIASNAVQMMPMPPKQPGEPLSWEEEKVVNLVLDTSPRDRFRACPDYFYRSGDLRTKWSYLGEAIAHWKSACVSCRSSRVECRFQNQNSSCMVCLETGMECRKETNEMRGLTESSALNTKLFSRETNREINEGEDEEVGFGNNRGFQGLPGLASNKEGLENHPPILNRAPEAKSVNKQGNASLMPDFAQETGIQDAFVGTFQSSEETNIPNGMDRNDSARAGMLNLGSRAAYHVDSSHDSIQPIVPACQLIQQTQQWEQNGTIANKAHKSSAPTPTQTISLQTSFQSNPFLHSNNSSQSNTTSPPSSLLHSYSFPSFDKETSTTMAPQTRKRNRSKRDDESDPSTEQQEPQGNKKVKINIAKNNKSSSAPTAHPPLPSPASPPNAIPCTKKPTISQSSTEQPSTEQPSTEQPSTKESSTDKPPTEQVKKTFKRPESLWVPTNGERETYIYGTRNGTDVLDLSTMREVVGHVPFINGQYPFWLKDLVVDHQFFSKRDELEELMAKGHETVTTLEKVFDVPEGVNVFDKLKSLKTRPENDDIIESVLAFATHQMVFADKFAFPGEKIMREIIRHAVGYDEVTDMFIQDYRHRTVLKCPKFAEQKEALIQEYHKKLNTLMFHFVGGSTETSKAHRSIALSAVNANIKMASFVGYTQRPIWARSGADFDPALHAVEMEEAEIGVKKDHSGQKILLTRAFGVERKIPNGAWFTVIKAYVILFEK